MNPWLIALAAYAALSAVVLAWALLTAEDVDYCD